MPKELFTPPQNPVDLDQVRALRIKALERANEEDVLTVKPEESQWLGHEARLAAETGTHDIPDISAHRAAEAPESTDAPHAAASH